MVNLSRAWNLSRFFVAIGIFCTATLPAHAENDYPLIVEVQIAGQKASDDFVKIYNPSDSDIFLGNYRESYLRLVKRTGSSNKDYSIKSWSKDSATKIPKKGYFLWASSKDESFPAKIKADSQTSQTLAENNGIALRVGPGNTGEIIDSVGWGEFNNVLLESAAFPRNPEAGQILSRKENAGFFQDTNNNQEDFHLKSAGSEKIISENEILPDVSTEQKTQDPPVDTNAYARQKATKYYPGGVIFNEILASPEGPDETEEWIEFFNANNFEVDLSDWQVKDAAGGIKTYIFPENAKIRAKEYFILKRPNSKITLNNDGDGLELIRPDAVFADKIAFGKSPQNASYNLTESGWLWSGVPTPGEKNIIQPLLNEEKGAEASDVAYLTAEKSLASAGQPFKTNGKPAARYVVTFFAAFLLAGFSGIAILFLKKKITNKCRGR